LNAKPLVIGKAGYSDIGDMENTADGYLGDMRFNRGERIGNLVLAAEAAYGEGIFMAFGDTTLFQNTVIPYSYPFIDNIFAYLCKDNKTQGDTDDKNDFFKMSCIIDASHLENIGRDKSDNAADGLMASLMRAKIMPYLNQSANLMEMVEECHNTGLFQG